MEGIWDITGIKDFEALIVDNGHGGETLSMMTGAVICCSHLVNLPEITEGNYAEFFERVDSAQKLAPVWYNTMNGVTKPVSVTIEDVKRHIGLTTNATYRDRFEWEEHFSKIL